MIMMRMLALVLLASVPTAATAQLWTGWARSTVPGAPRNPPADVSPSTTDRENVSPDAPKDDTFALPDPTMTPGASDPSVGLDRICNETTRRRRHVTPQTRAKVLRDYSVSEMQSVGMELDHLVPLAIGGSNAAANLWPQPSPDYEMKDVLEHEMQRRACVAYRTLTPSDAAAVLTQEQREIAEDWVAAYRRYIGPLQATR